MSSVPRSPPLHGFVLDRRGTVLARATRMVILGQRPPRLTSIRGVAEVRPPLKRCPECYWLRIPHVGALRIRAVRFDPAPRGKSIFHFRVLSLPLHLQPVVADSPEPE